MRGGEHCAVLKKTAYLIVTKAAIKPRRRRPWTSPAASIPFISVPSVARASLSFAAREHATRILNA